MKKISTSAIALGLAASVFAATPAFAAAYDGSGFDLGNVNYSGLNDNSFALDDTWASDAWMTANPQWGYPDIEYQYLNTNWDGVGYISIDSTSYEGGVDCDKVTDGADVVVVCPVETIAGLEVHPEIRFYDSEMMSRLVWVIENKTSADITAPVSVSFASECDDNGYMETSGGDSGEDATGWDMDSSGWSVQRGTTYSGDSNERCGIETAAWQGPEATILATTTLNSTLDGQLMDYNPTVKAGKKIALAYFFANAWVSDGNENPDTAGSVYTVNRAAAFDGAVTTAGSRFGSWNETLSKGLSSDLYVANWIAEPPATLPNTGIDAGAVGFAATGAVALALVGAGMVFARRRRAQA